MIPLRDENPTLMTPWITFALIAANVIVWVYVQGAGLSETALVESICRYGTIPADLTGRATGYEGIQLGPGAPPCPLGGSRREALLTSLTGMFLHGSWMHLLANMWFLWLFGNNIEDSMGHLRYALFYVLAGVAAIAAHIVSSPGSPVPTVGASGAISGVMGAYLLLYPRVRIQTLIFLVIFIRIVAVPAWLVLMYWFALQVLSGYSTQLEEATGGVAFWAHVGGFVAGVVLVKLFENRTLVDARRRHIRLQPGQIRHHGWW